MTADTSSVERLARVADILAARGVTGRRFLRGLAWNCGGIRPGVAGYVDLGAGGSNRFPGRGFRCRYDDGTDGQARHFSGIAVSPLMLTEPVARFAARYLLGDPAASADGRLSEAAFEFSRLIRTGRLSAPRAGGWIREHIAA